MYVHFSDIECLDREGKYLLFSRVVLQYQLLKCGIEIKSSHYQYLQVQQISMQHLWTLEKYLRNCL